MLVEIALNDQKNEHWELLLPGVFRRNRLGMYVMWVYVAKGPPSLTEGAYRYQEIPLPVFTEWWEPC